MTDAPGPGEGPSGDPDGGAAELGRLSLPAAPASVTAARKFTLACLGVAEEGYRDVVALLTTEVVTNAVLHAVSPVVITVTETSAALRVAVHDDDSQLPVMHDHGVDASTGRGMRLVEAMSQAWGAVPERFGKTVWFEVPRRDAVLSEGAG